MSVFTKVVVRRGNEGLKHSKGFWSGKDVLFNIDNCTINVLDERTTTQDLLDTIIAFINTDIRDWVLWDMERNIKCMQKKEISKIFFNLQDISSLQRPEWFASNGRGSHAVSLAQMIRFWQKNGEPIDGLSEFLADEWVSAWRKDTNLYPFMNWAIPTKIPLARLLLTRWDRLDSTMPLERFLQALWNLSEMDLSGARFLGPGAHSERLYTAQEHYYILRDGLLAEERELLNKFDYGPCLNAEDALTRMARRLVAAPVSACLAMMVLAQEGLILTPPNVVGNSGLCINYLGWLDPFKEFFKRPSERYGLSYLLASSTIAEPADIPADIRTLAPGTILGKITKPLRAMLSEYGQLKGLQSFDVTPLERGVAHRVDDEMRMWRSQWFRDQGYSQAWCEFAEAAYQSSRAGKAVVADQLKSICEWALDRFESPWDITPLDLINPHKPKNVETFAAYCKKRIPCAGKDGKDPKRRWDGAATIFKRIKNFVSIPGYPGYREGAANPFELLEPPFKGNSNKSQKTHRPRIATLIHEKMIEVLLDLDEQGKPTFAWARTQRRREDSSAEGVWCPSRWTALALLLLLPPRKKSVRWLDQGLMDEKVFDPETFKMVDNSHPLREYTYEDGKTHLQRYGRPSGAIQQMTDDFTGSSAHIGLFINTNKTQLWNPEKRNGYELPWPDGSELLVADDEELRQQGLWLRRVYEVLAYQYQHVLEHDKNPTPVAFSDVQLDKDSVSVDKDCEELLPRFVPLFRDTVNKKQIDRNGQKLYVALPVTDYKLAHAYTLLCIETETRLKQEGYDTICLTKQHTSDDPRKSGVSSIKTKFDIHCLRVAGISRLIEIGIDPVIVQEFVAGHLTPAMTHRYLKMQPWHVREKIIEAIVNGDFNSALETFAEKVAKGEWNRADTFVRLPRFQELVGNLPEDFACISVVKGGICVMGGKGGACNEGGVYERQGDGNDTVDFEFGPVQGGCGNCIHFRTAAFLIQEQALVLNILLAELRAQARERKELRTKVTDITCKVDEAEDSAEKHRLISDKNLYEARIEEVNHDMVPRLTDWVNRYIMLKECEGQLDELMQGKTGATTLVAPFGETIGLTAEDLKVDQVMTSDIGLIGLIVEGSRILGARGIVVPEDHARFLERGVDKLLRMNGSQHLLLDIPTSERSHGASMMFNALEDLIGAEVMQEALDSETPLAFSESLRNDVNQFASALVGAAKKGALTVENLLDEGRNCNMVTDPKNGDDRWAM